MWDIISVLLVASRTTTATIFSSDQVIFTSTGNITNLLVQFVDNKFQHAASSDLPSVFFTLTDPNFEGGTCIYVLEDLAAYEILEGGRDSTADYGSDKNVYFGSKDGVYKYDRDSLSAKRYGPFKDDIIQIQKANGTDKIYYLTDDKKLFTLESNGTVRTKVAILSVSQFVLDTSNNIYYVEYKTNLIYILKTPGKSPIIVVEDFADVKLIRPAVIMDDCIPLFGDGTLYILYFNGTIKSKDFYIAERPSAFSVDTALYLTVALDGKIYEYNVMEMLLKSMYGLGAPWPQDVNKIIMSVLAGSKNVVGSDYKGTFLSF